MPKEAPNPEFTRHSDGSITITLHGEDISLSGTVSSDHLIQPKLNQLASALAELESAGG